jgi:diguanylate cyclase (GGDEF)-like protein
MSRDRISTDPLSAGDGRRWHRVVRVTLVVMMIASTAGMLGIVVRNSVQLGRMTTQVSIAQQRTTTLHNTQLSALQLGAKLSELGADGDIEAVTVRRGLLGRTLTIVAVLYPAGSEPAGELREMRTGLGRFPWDRLAETGGDRAERIGVAKALVSRIELRVKAMYDEQEKFFYAITLDSLDAKRINEKALVVLVSLLVATSVCWLLLMRRRTRGRLVLAYDSLLSEVSERRALQDQLSHQAYHDSLTGLPNRALYLERLQDAIRGAEETSGTPAALLFDLDGFKAVNDTLGHGAGDELLQRIAGRLRACVRDGDTVARLGGDEFAIVVPAGSGGDATALSRRLIDALQAPIPVGAQEISISASIGIAYLDGQTGPDDLLSDADIAMYAAKKAGKARYEVFRPAMRDETLHRARLEQQLARAVGHDEIEVFYQPITDLRTDRITGLEALARWRHPGNGLIPPGVFIPIAEESGLIREIGREVLRQACRTVHHWRQTVPGHDQLGVAVNVSVRQLISGTFSGHLRDALRESGLPASALTLEITESLMLEESDTLAAELILIKDLGVRLAMDDFGAGYSSIASLLRLQVEVLKIDKAFLDLDNREGGTLVRAVAELGHTLGLTVIAEGVETEEQLAHVRAAHCDAAQGYLLARPMPEAAARTHLEHAGALHAVG